MFYEYCMLPYAGGNFMPTFIVNSAILRPNTDPKACAINTKEIFNQSGIKDVKMQSCYCCSEQGRTVFIMQGPSQDATLEAFQRINVPVESIMEVEDVTQLPKSAQSMSENSMSSKTSTLRKHAPLIVGGAAVAAVATAAAVAVATKKKQESNKGENAATIVSDPL